MQPQDRTQRARLVRHGWCEWIRARRRSTAFNRTACVRRSVAAYASINRGLTACMGKRMLTR